MISENGSQQIRALLFDMDGLLFDSERVVQRTWNMAGEELGVGRVGEQIYHTLGLNLKSRTAFFYKIYGSDFPMDVYKKKTREYFRQIEEDEGIPLKTGVREILQFGKDHGYRMCVVTSSRREHSAYMLKKGKIDSFFDGMVCGDMVQKAKPDPEIYLKAAEVLAVKPEQCIALEDSPNGIRSAYAAGMYPVMVPDLVAPDKEITKLAFSVAENLLEVRAILEKWTKSGI